ncbi:reverse transcriptase [Phytophthora megakarya]|uniref:Reverse transcriptase n=1 Tax=Phytophthora megakarya TaxID=4795 RepID=A0A225UWR6_9STRA|nr:reverse transcriptase [Phytophthora megakarya]
MGDGKAVPAPVRGVICDLDVGEANPVAQRPRSVAPRLSIKLKKRLETRLIEHSESPWASPIVIVLKKNGVNIRMSVDYRIVKLSNYHLPLIDDLLVGLGMFHEFGHGEWVLGGQDVQKDKADIGWARMPFRFKNAPLIYQSDDNNFLWGFVWIPRIIKNLKGAVQKTKCGTHRFQRNVPKPSHIGPVLGRSSYIGIAYGVKRWDELCEDLDTLPYRLRYWNISVSLPKSEFGKRWILYLSHEISAEGIRAIPKVVKGVMDLPFPKSHKGVLSFLGNLNYYHKFIEDYPVLAAVLYRSSFVLVLLITTNTKTEHSFAYHG